MRKSFTRLLSLIMLFSVFSLSFALAQPTLDDLYPEDNASGVEYQKGESFVMTFSEPMAVASGSGIVGLYNSSGVQIEAISVTDPLPGSISIVDEVVSITFDYDFVEEEEYFITVTSNALKSASTGLYFEGITYTTSGGPWNFTVGDYTAPELLSRTPMDYDEAGSGDNTPTLVLEFNEEMEAGAGNIDLYQVGANGEGFYVQSIPAADFTFSSSEPFTATETLGTLNELTEYYVRVDGDAFRDLSTHDLYYEGVSDNSWSFVTADVTAPNVPTFTVNDETDVAVGEAVVVEFTDNRTSAMVPQDFNLYLDGDLLVAGDDITSASAFEINSGGFTDFTVTYVGDNKIEITPDNGWASEANYVVSVNDNLFEDVEGNEYVHDAADNFEFTAGDFEPAIITVNSAEAASGTSSRLNSTDIYLNVSVNDASTGDSGQPVDLYYMVVANGATAPTVAQVIANNTKLASKVSGGTTDPLVHEGDVSELSSGATLASNTAYDIYFAAVDNATTPNSSATVVAETGVTTNDVEAPVITSLELEDKSTSTVDLIAGDDAETIDKASSITITFDEDVILAANDDVELIWDDGSSNGVTLTEGTDYSVAVSNNVITVTPNHGFADYGASFWKSSGEYQLTLKDEKVTDTFSASPNKMAEVSYNFKVEDYTGPVPVFNIASNNDGQVTSDVPTASNITIDFGEKVTRANGNDVDENNIFFRDGATNIVPATITVTDQQYVTINPTDDLDDDDASYTVEITSTIKDLSGNQLGWYDGTDQAISNGVLDVNVDAYKLELTTADETEPTVTFTPVTGTTITKSAFAPLAEVSLNEQVYDANDNPVSTTDENFMRTLVTVENITSGNEIDFDITNGVNGDPASFEIDLSAFVTELNAEESYKVTVTGLYDAAGNKIDEASATYTVQEYDAPNITQLSPLDGATDVAPSDDLVITFDENVDDASGNINIYDGSDALMESIDASTTTINGNVVTITPTFGTFDANTDYYVLIDDGAFVDLNDDPNAFEGISSKTTWNFTGLDDNYPTITSTEPSNGDVVKKPNQLVIEFDDGSDKIIAGPGKVFVREAGNTGIPDLTIMAQDATVVSISGTTVTITVDEDFFDYDGGYWVEIEANAFKDPSGNYFAGWLGNTGNWEFSIESDPLPYYDVANSDPADEETNVSLDQNFKIKFSEPVYVNDPTDKNLTIHKASNNTSIITVDFDSPTINYSWNSAHDELTVNDPTLLDPDQDYYVNVDPGTFEDAAGQIIPGPDHPTKANWLGDLNGDDELNFSTKDLIAPTIDEITVNGTDISDTGSPVTGIDDEGNIVITFSEPVTIADPASAVSLSDGSSLTFDATFSNNILTINADNEFVSEATIEVSIDQTQVLDQSTWSPLELVDNGVVGSFIVEDKIVPTWTTGEPTSTGGNNLLTNTAGIDDDGKVYYIVTLDGNLSSPTAQYVKDNATNSVAVDANTTESWDVDELEGETEYDVYFVAEDHAGNLMDDADVKKIDVSTLDNVKPVLTDYYPTGTCIKNQVSGGTDFYMIFDEDISIGTPEVWVRKASDHTAISGVSVSVQSYDNTTDPVTPAALIINVPQGSLDEVTDYYIELNPGWIEDLNGNPMESYFWGTNAWTFETADETAPTIALDGSDWVVSPEVGTVLAANDNDLSITFDEPVTPGSGYIYIWQVGEASAHEIINVTSTSDVVMSNDDKTATITTYNNFSDGIEYYVTFEAGTFVDKACDPNEFAGIQINATTANPTADPEYTDHATEDWWFIGKDDLVPEVISFTPEADASDVDIATDITIRFSEVMYKTNGDPLDENWIKSYVKVNDGEDNIAYSASIDDAVSVSFPYVHDVTEVTINPNSDLDSETEYTVTLNGSKFEDEGEQTLTDNTVWSFTTGDFTAPVVTWEPVDGYEGAEQRQVVTITFDGPVVFSNNVTLNDVNVDNIIEFVRTNDSEPVAYDAEVSEDKTQIIITPDEDLNSYYEYTLNLRADLNPIKEQAEYGNDVSGTSKELKTLETITIKTTDFDAPVADSYAPQGDGASQSDDLVINLEQIDDNGSMELDSMAAGEGNVNIYRSNGTVFEVVPAADCTFDSYGQVLIPHTQFETNTSYYVTFNDSVFTDVNGHKLAGISGSSTWRFSTSDDSSPMVAEFITPVHTTVDATIKTDLVLRFTENVDFATAGNVVLYDQTGRAADEDGDIVETISTASGVLSGSNVNNGLTTDIVTFELGNDLESGHKYYVKIDAGTFEDVDGYTFDGLLSLSDWYFTVGDNEPPVAISAVPALDTEETIEGGSQQFVLTFDKNIALGSGDISLYQYFENPAPGDANSKLIETIAATEDMVEADSLTFSFSSKLEDAIDNYYLLLEPGVVTNTSANAIQWEGFTDPFDWTFVTEADVEAPVLVETNTNVDSSITPDAVVAELILEDFNGISDVLNGQFLLVEEGADPVAIDNSRVTVLSTPDANGFSIDPDTVRITFVDELSEEKEYYIMVGDDVITDNSNSKVAFEGIFDDSWSFSINDFTAPQPIAGSCAPNGLNNLESDSIALTIEFNEDIQPGNDSLTITKVADNTVVFKQPVTAENIVGDTMVVMPVIGVLEDTTEYAVTYAEGFVKDMPYGEYTTTNDVAEYPGTWTFTTDDNVAPVIAGVTPTGNDNGSDVSLVIKADEPVTAVAGSEITLISAVDTFTVMTDDLTYDAGDTTFTAGVVGLSDEVSYTVSVPEGAFEDNAVVANSTAAIEWSFGTGDNTAPVLAGADSLSNHNEVLDTYLGVEIIATFSEAVIAGEGNITVSNGTDDQVFSADSSAITFKGDSVLIAANLFFGDWTVTFEEGAVTDGAGNAYAATDDWTFSIVDDEFDASCLDRAHFMPFDGDSNIPRDTALTIMFCEKVVPGDANAMIQMYIQSPGEDNILYDEFVVTEEMISEDGMVVSVPLTGLPSYTTFDVLVNQGAIEDEAGNAYAGFTSPSFWNFTTGDTEDPVIEAISMENPEAAVNNATVTVEFSEQVDIPANGITIESGEIVSFEEVSEKVWDVEVYAEDDSVVTLTFNQEITDVSDLYNSLDQAYTYTYTVGDNTKPEVTITSIQDDPIMSPFVVNLTFNEDVENVQEGLSVSGDEYEFVMISPSEYNVAITAAEEAEVIVALGDIIADMAGNTFVPVDTAFTVGDFTAPTVTADPETADSLDNNFSVELTFSEDAIVNKDQITVEGGDAMIAKAENIFTVDITTVDMAEVTINVADTIVDEAGNEIAGQTSFNYFVGDNTAPTVYVDPESANDTINEIDITLVFNEEVTILDSGIVVSEPATVTFAPYKGRDVYKVTIEAPDYTEVVMTLTGQIVDDWGNAFESTNYTYIIGDNNAPELTVEPGESVDMPNEFDLSLTFNEDVTGVSEALTVLGATSYNLSGEGSEYTLSIAAKDEVRVDVHIDQRVVDMSQRSYKGEIFTYIIGDHVAPVVTVDPATDVDMPTEFNVSAVFSDDAIVSADDFTVTGAETFEISNEANEYTIAITAAEEDTVEVAIAETIVDEAGNAIEGDLLSTYIIGDFTAPVVTADPASGIAMDTVFNVVLTFSEDAIVTAEDIDVAGAEAEINNEENVFTVAVKAEEEADVTISVDETVADEAGNAIEGEITFNYTTGDFTNPTVVVEPVSGDASDEFEVMMTFSDDAIVTDEDITVEGAASYELTNEGTVYTASIIADDNTVVNLLISDAIADEAGNLIEGDLEYTYTIGDNTAPTVYVDPVAAADTVNVFDLTLFFSEPVVIPEGAISVNSPATIDYNKINGNVYKATIDAPDGTTVVMTLSNEVVDISGNALEASEYIYTIGDHVAPTVSADVADGAEVANNFEVNLTFSEEVENVEEGITVKGGEATITGQGAEYNVAIEAEDGKTVILTVASTITDLAGNAVEKTVYDYTVGDNTAPTVVSVDPSEGDEMETEFAVNIVFSEEVTAVADGINVSEGTVSVTGSGANYVATITADNSANVTLSLGADITDLAGNSLTSVDYSYTVKAAYPEVTIAEIQGTGDETPYADQIVVTSGTVTGVDESGAGFFMQDANDARSGIYVYDSELAANVGVGTSVKVTATATEHYTLTQLTDVIAHEFTAKVVETQAIEITAAEVGEDYEGVLVKVDSLKTTELPSDDSYGEWYTADTENDVDVTIDEQLFTFVPDAGQRYNITGVCNYTFEEYKLAPRNLEDIEIVTGIKMLDINIDIYPNPFDTYVKFDVSRDVEITKAVITNIAGQLVKQVDYPENTIRTDELRSGVYFISLQTAEGIAKTERIIKR